MKRRAQWISASFVLGLSAAVNAHPPIAAGVVVPAEVRFDPSVQRLLADRALKLMPLRDGALYYIVPIDADPYFEQQQIRYLEALLDDQVEPDRNAQ